VATPVVVLPSGQRIRLAPGRHDSVGEGACVVELASILAAEPFSDSPRCVDPVIASYLRAWNDRVAYSDRQRLAPYAARIIDSRLPGDAKRRRRDLCLAACGADLSGGGLRRGWTRLGMRLRIAVFVGWVEAIRLDHGAGEFAARVLIGRRDLDGAFELLERLLDLGQASRPSTNGFHPPVNGNGRANGHADWLGANGIANGNGRVAGHAGAEDGSDADATDGRRDRVKEAG
jgi:hypothetical protein